MSKKRMLELNKLLNERTQTDIDIDNYRDPPRDNKGVIRIRDYGLDKASVIKAIKSKVKNVKAGIVAGEIEVEYKNRNDINKIQMVLDKKFGKHKAQAQ